VEDAANFTVAAVKKVTEQSERMEAELAHDKKATASDPVKKAREKAIAESMLPPGRSVRDAREKVVIKENAKAAKDADAAIARGLAYKIKQYLERFPDLSPYVGRIPANPSATECEIILGIIRDRIQSKKSLESLKQKVGFILNAIETVWGDGTRFPRVPKPLRFDLSGLGTFYNRGLFTEFDPILAEIDIEYPQFGQQNLFTRALSAFAQALFIVHKANTDPATLSAMSMQTKDPVDLGSDMEGL
jgi:hypothetical protein